MGKLEDKIYRLRQRPLEDIYAQSGTARRIFKCSNGVEVIITPRYECLCCDAPVSVYNARGSNYEIDAKSTVLERITFCSSCEQYSYDLYILFNYLLGTKVHMLTDGNQLSEALFQFSIPIKKAVQVQFKKAVSVFRRTPA